MRRSSSLLASLIILFLPLQVWACACCSDPGAYRISFHEPSEYELSLLQEIRFSKTAHIYETDADIEEDALGLGSLPGLYSASGMLTSKVWKLALRNGTKSGTLSLPLPDKMLTYLADIRDGKISAGGGPLLYKEWRFEGELTGTGLFKGPNKYFLVLQGRGNMCDNSGDFKNWRLEMSGAGSRYAFYGSLAKPVP
jgi:hypothetical protein